MEEHNTQSLGPQAKSSARMVHSLVRLRWQTAQPAGAHQEHCRAIQAASGASDECRSVRRCHEYRMGRSGSRIPQTHEARPQGCRRSFPAYGTGERLSLHTRDKTQRQVTVPLGKERRLHGL